MSIFPKFFSDLSRETQEKLLLWMEEMRAWNEKINLISRKDIEHLEEKHLLPSLAFQKAVLIQPNMKILDIGTGGGCPGIPLAICHPEADFLLVDSVGKKLEAVKGIVKSLGLKNVLVMHSRVEAITGAFNLVLGRAVVALPTFLSWAEPKLKPKGVVAYLKGGPLEEDLLALKLKPTKQLFLQEIFPSMDYEGKYIACFDAPALKRVVFPSSLKT